MNRSSSARNSSSHNRAAKAEVLLCVVGLTFGVCLGWSLSVPDTIQLPDSLGPLRPPYHLAFGSSTDNIYVASESSDIVVVDGSFAGNFQRIKRIKTCTPVGSALLVSAHNKLYCSFPYQARIGVIDCSTNSIIGSIDVGWRPTLLRYSSLSDKLYCGDTVACTISVIDCATDEVLKDISVGESLAAMAYDPATNKLYAGTRDGVQAISCSCDSIVATIDAVRSSRAFCMNQHRRELYTVVPWAVPDTIFVISTTDDSVTAKMTYTCIDGFDPIMGCNEVTDRLYCMGSSAIWEFDCRGDSFVRSAYAGDYVMEVTGMFCDTVRNRLYCLIRNVNGGFCLLAWDCAAFSLISETGVGNGYFADFQTYPARYGFMCASGDPLQSTTLMVFDYKGDNSYMRAVVPLGVGGRYLCRNPLTGKLYCPWTDGVTVIDEQTNRVVAQARVPQMFDGGTFSQTSNKLYYTWYCEGLGVMDGQNDSPLGFIKTGFAVPGPCPCWCPDGNKVYCFADEGARYYVAVIDCSTDSVVRGIDVYDHIVGFEYLGHERMLCIRYEGLTLFDTRTDSVLVDSATEPSASPVFRTPHAQVGEKVYAVRRNGRLEARSSSSLSLLDTIIWAVSGMGGDYLVQSDATNKLYWLSLSLDSMLVIDATVDTVVDRIGVSLWPDCICLDRTGSYLFCAGSYSDRKLRVFDTRSDSLVAVYPNLPTASSLVSSPEQHSIYVGCQDVILVYPDTPPGVEETMNDEREVTNTLPTMVRSVLLLPQAFPLTPSFLLAADGRGVKDLLPGENDVRDIPPGVYFVRTREPARTHKIIIVR